MTSVIVVEDDTAFLRSIERELRREGLDVRPTTDVEEALRWLEQDDADVLLTDLRMNGMSGIELLERARDLAPSTRSVLMSGFATARDYETALELGAVRVLCKPFSTDQLIDAVRQALECNTGFRGSIHGLGLIDLLQMFHYGKRSISISINSGRCGRVYVEHGEIIHAERGAATGEAALSQILALPKGALKTEPFSPPAKQTIHRSFQCVLLDSLRVLDESAEQGETDDRLAFRSMPPQTPVAAAPSDVQDLPISAASIMVVENAGEQDLLPLRKAILPGPRDATLLQSRFESAFREPSARVSTLIALGMELSGGGFVRLRGESDSAAFIQPVRDAIDAATKISKSDRGVLERFSPGVAMYIVWSTSLDAAYVLADGVRSSSEGAWLRAVAQTFARRLFGEEA